MPEENQKCPKFFDLSPLQRTLTGLLAAAAAFFIAWQSHAGILLGGVLAWIAFSAVFLFFSWGIILYRGVEEIEKKAHDDDGGVVFVFVFIILSSIASMIAVLLLSTSKDKEIQQHVLYLPATVAAMIFSWFMIHSQYIFHYAHEYYDDDKDSDNDNHGLDFPEDDKPNYLDFAYFSFCMGCTFQVSDVDVINKIMRKITMVHGLLAFFINTFVVALTINLVAGMSK